MDNNFKLPDFAEVARALRESGGTAAKMLPSRVAVRNILADIQCLMFPDYFPRDCCCAGSAPEERLALLYEEIKTEIAHSFYFVSGDEESDLSASLASDIISSLPMIKGKLMKDIRAIYEGDPAAVSEEEVVLSYPGFYAISIYRIAHEFYVRKIPFLPRMMTEYAHAKTGIDIHAGATVGEYFFIDHGTGIVIGETTTIGDHVKIYQGVTLGAKSFELDDDGNPVKGIKRHPNIGNNVIIYANATILGGNTYVGDGCVIGGNVWLTHSVEPGKTVYYSEKK